MSLYDDSFFQRHRDLALSSAREIVPLVVELTRPESVVDLGCARGEWLSVFSEHGVADIFGLDGDYVDQASLLLPHEKFQTADLAAGAKLDRRFDLAMSLEVAEHLPEASAETFVQSLVDLAPIVLFSAAIPQQGGKGHLNEQWQDYWAALFEARGYFAVDALRRQLWSNDSIRRCYAQNLLLYVDEETLSRNDALRLERERTTTSALNLVHPYTFLKKAKPSTKKILRLLRRDLKARVGRLLGRGRPRG